MIASAKLLPELKKRLLSTKQLKQPKILTGIAGEQRALNFLLSKNYTLLAQNVRFGNYELDLVMLDTVNNEVVFVEVKSRASGAYGDPSLAVNFRKLKAMRKAAIAYLKATNLPYNFRFDVISVLPNSVQHFENITLAY